MPSAANIVIRLDDTTDVTLVPVSSLYEKGKVIVRYRELNSAKSLDACIRLTLESETLNSGVVRNVRKLEIPVMEIIPPGAVNSNGYVATSKVSHVETDIRTRLHSPRSTPTERANSLKAGTHVDIGAGSAVGAAVLGITGAPANAWRDAANTYAVPYADINYVWPSA